MRSALLAAALLITGCAASAQQGTAAPEASGATFGAVDEADVEAAARDLEAAFDADEVRDAVVALFDGMRASDSAAVRAVIHPGASFRTVVPEGDGFRLAQGDAEAFIAAVGAPKDQVWDERVGEIEVQVDQGLATAWMPYAFYLGETFSHCGVNAMQFAKTNGTWRIVHLIDTRRQECESLVGEG